MSALNIVSALGIIILFLAGVVLLIRLVNTPEKIRGRYKGTDASHDIFVKKYREADVERYRGIFMRLGLISITVLMILMFNWTRREGSETRLFDIRAEEEIVVDVPATQQVQPPPPPPPPPAPLIDVVEDQKVVEADPVIVDVEVEMDEEVIIEETVVPIEVEAVVEPEPEPEEPEIFSIVEEMPEFPGGDHGLMAYLGANLTYPPIARENGIEGTVVVRFVVEESGEISNIEVVKDIGGGCGNEAVRVVNGMPAWNPGRQRGKPVHVWFTLPVRFRLD